MVGQHDAEQRELEGAGGKELNLSKKQIFWKGWSSALQCFPKPGHASWKPWEWLLHLRVLVEGCSRSGGIGWMSSSESASLNECAMERTGILLARSNPIARLGVPLKIPVSQKNILKLQLQWITAFSCRGTNHAHQATSLACHRFFKILLLKKGRALVLQHPAGAGVQEDLDTDAAGAPTRAIRGSGRLSESSDTCYA